MTGRPWPSTTVSSPTSALSSRRDWTGLGGHGVLHGRPAPARGVSVLAAAIVARFVLLRRSRLRGVRRVAPTPVPAHPCPTPACTMPRPCPTPRRTLAHPCPRPDEALRRVHRRRRRRLRRRARRIVRVPGSQRRRQDLDDADDRLRLAGHRRARSRSSAMDPDTRRAADPGSRLGVVPQQDTLDTELTVRENLVIYGRYFGLPRAEVRPPRRRAARLRPAHRARRTTRSSRCRAA